jgi:hypothetical protein
MRGGFGAIVTCSGRVCGWAMVWSVPIPTQNMGLGSSKALCDHPDEIEALCQRQFGCAIRERSRPASQMTAANAKGTT